ncbi:hypothetical protein ACFSUK_03260 [Sphingobium scionense]
MSLGAVLLSYHVLPATEFTELNLILFCVAAGSSLAAPINRNFWLEDPERAFAPASASSMVLTWGAVLIGYAVPHILGYRDIGSITASFAAILYVFSKSSERFLYSLTLSRSNINQALFIMLVFSFSEILSLAFMYVMTLESVGYRLALPALIFICFIGFTRFRTSIRQTLITLRTPRNVLADIYTLTVRAPGPSVLLLTAAMTAAGMIDRLFVAYGNIFDARLGADYLLALSYAIALQTVLNILFDIARRHIFFQDQWQPRAKAYSTAILGMLLGTCLVAIAFYPLFTAFKIIPSTIAWITWAAMALRSTALLAGYICFVDMFQKGNTMPALTVAISILASVILFFVFLGTGVSLVVSSSVMAAALLVVLLTLCIRLPLAIKKQAALCTVGD